MTPLSSTIAAILEKAAIDNGFDLELDVHEPIKEIGEAIAGMVRKVGIRASVRPLPLTLYVRMRGEGKFTAFLGFYPTNAQPDMDNLFDFFFEGNRDYWSDPVIKDLEKAGKVEFDEEKRIAIYQKQIGKVALLHLPQFVAKAHHLPTNACAALQSFVR